MEPVTLTAAEIERVTGYTQPARQLAMLLQLGFYRARRAKVTGEVILERPHYDAIAAGNQAAQMPGQASRGPRLRAV